MPPPLVSFEIKITAWNLPVYCINQGVSIRRIIIKVSPAKFFIFLNVTVEEVSIS